VNAVVVRIPGPPFSQPRPRARARGKFAQVYEPKEAKSWKGAAQVHMQEALRAAGLGPPAFNQAIDVVIEAVFPCPKADYRKSAPVGRRPYVGLKDWENVAKAICDAANGILYLDDRQIAHGDVWCWVGAQDEAPYVQITVRPFRWPMEAA
jgi:Holliday junction resolvase RusA-like endonuclease